MIALKGTICPSCHCPPSALGWSHTHPHNKYTEMLQEPAAGPGSWVFLSLTPTAPSDLPACSQSLSHHFPLGVPVLLRSLRVWKWSQAPSVHTHFTMISNPLPHPGSRHGCSLILRSSKPSGVLSSLTQYVHIRGCGHQLAPAYWTLPGSSDFLFSSPLALEISLWFIVLYLLLFFF